jgi:hypothetical protein
VHDQLLDDKFNVRSRAVVTATERYARHELRVEHYKSPLSPNLQLSSNPSSSAAVECYGAQERDPAKPRSAASTGHKAGTQRLVTR